MNHGLSPDRTGWARCGAVALALLLGVAPAALAQFKVSEGGATPPNAFGIYKMWYDQKGPGTPGRRPYFLFCPVGYEDPTKKWPLLIFLHGAGERGTDFGALDTHGPIRHAQDDEKFRKGLPMVVVSPQCPPDKDWTSPEMTALVGELMQLAIQKYHCDPDRVYLTGLSLGGTGTWHVAAFYADKLAAIMPICARATDQERLASVLKKVPAWIIVGDSDGDFTRDAQNMYTLLMGHKDPCQLTKFPNEGHGVWTKVYPDLRYYAWLARQKRVGAAPAVTFTEAQLADAEKKVQAAEVALAAKEYPKAIKLYAGVVGTYPGSTFAASAKEQLTKLKNDPAIKAEIETAELNAQAEALEAKAKAADAAKDYAAAQRMYEQYVKSYPKAEHFDQIKARLDALKNDTALQTSLTAGEADKECREWLSLADAYIAANKPEVARTQLNKIVTKYPTTAWAQQAKDRLSKLPPPGNG